VKRKVLIIVENESVPPDPRVSKEARSLHANGYEVTVLCPWSKGRPQRHELFEGIHIYRHPRPKEGHGAAGYVWEYSLALFWEFLHAWWIYLRHGFHVIQSCNPPDDIFLIALPFKLLGVKYIFDHHDASPELYLAKTGKKGFVYRLLLWLEKMTYRFSDAVMVTNESYKDLATNRGRVASDDVFIVRNGPDHQTFKTVAANPALKDGKSYLIGYVGNMDVQDGLDILVEVAGYIKNLGRRDIGFACVGGGPELPNLRKMVEDKDLVDTVTFTGRVPDGELLEILSTADVCVNPDRPCEMNDISTMIKIMEYMALGKPIVQFDSKEGRFSAQGASLYADKVDGVADFANKILWLLERPNERKKMGEFGRRRVERELGWEHSVENLLAAYERAFSKRVRHGAAVSRKQTRVAE
jgi:glycosyltransferase involved in cell wall biosynthesis